MTSGPVLIRSDPTTVSQATGPFVVPPSVRLVPVETLDAEVRKTTGAEVGDFAVMRPGSRARAKIVDAATAELLESFREPRRITDAIIAFSRGREIEPEATLVAAFPRLAELVRDGFLVPAGAPGAQELTPTLANGTAVGGFHVTSCLRLLEDTELYQVRDAKGRPGALKIVGRSGSTSVAAMIHREARVLAHLSGRRGPRALATGTFDDRPYLIMDWCAGVSAAVAAREVHASSRGRDRQGLLSLASGILDAYADLHARGVVHGDVHAQNILVGADNEVTIMDFGLARVVADDAALATEIPRAGVAEFFEPEYVTAVAAGEPPPPATEMSDQYAVAALLFRLLTNRSYLGFSLRETDLYERIAGSPPLPFAECGVPPWPDVEAALGVALEKAPAARYQSMSAFAKRLKQARVRTPRSTARTLTTGLDQIQARVRKRIGPDGPLLREGLRTPPFVSVNFGAAGLAWAAYRFACIKDDAEWLATSELWLNRAAQMAKHPEAFLRPSVGLTREVIGETSLYHSPAGLHVVQATIASAFGDSHTHDRAVRKFVAASTASSDQRDLSFGAPGTLLACAMLCESEWPGVAGPLDPARELGTETMRRLVAWMESEAAAGDTAGMHNLGVAHGWAGVLYAALRWCAASRNTLPAVVTARLARLAECAEPHGRGARWRWIDQKAGAAGTRFMPGWCNGAAGFVHLWTAAHRAIGEDRFLELAELAARDAWEDPARSRSLCCGLAGRAYALLNLFRYTDDATWLNRATQLAVRAARGTPRPEEAEFPDSLFKGEVGIALLAADLSRPHESCMPFFESEGWPMTEAGG